MESIIVREATSQDAEEMRVVKELADAALRKVYRPTKAAIAHKARLDATLNRIVAITEGKVIGAVQYYIVENRLHLIGLAVHPAYQRRGVAGRLMAYLCERARTAAVEKLSLYTVKEMGNVPIFEKLGFQVISEKRDEWSESDIYSELTEVYMERQV
jgi:ribosomal protein S18 acetylase RimI-like enzyme